MLIIIAWLVLQELLDHCRYSFVLMPTGVCIPVEGSFDIAKLINYHVQEYVWLAINKVFKIVKVISNLAII